MTIEFSAAGYRSILSTALDAGYHPLNMRDALAARRGRVLLLRHDVDFSLEYAVRMAELERELGLHATYFLLLYNDYYNALSPSGRGLVARLTALGHEVGLHWDSSIYPREPEVLRDHFRRELATLGSIAGQPIVSASQHIPADSPFLDVASLIRNEAYSEPVRRRFTYVSDSAMKWRNVTPLDLIERRVEIQFLAHPLWWFAPGQTREQKLRTIPSNCSRRVSASCENFIQYMNGVLADRVAYDERFRRARGIES